MAKKRQELDSLLKSSNVKDPLSLYKAAEADFKVLLEQRKKAMESTNVMGLNKNVVNTDVFEFINPLRGMTVSSGNTMIVTEVQETCSRIEGGLSMIIL